MPGAAFPQDRWTTTVRDAEMETLYIRPDAFHGEWNTPSYRGSVSYLLIRLFPDRP